MSSVPEPVSAVHIVSPAIEEVPTGHSIGYCPALGHIYPAGHEVHAVPAKYPRLKVPAAQALGGLAVVWQKKPGGQDSHCVYCVLSW